MKKSRLPTLKECLDLLKEYRVPANIIRHSLAVTKLACFLAQALKRRSVSVDADLLERAALLHDVVRVCDFKELNYEMLGQVVTLQDKAKWAELAARYKTLGHELAAYEILKDKYPAVALTVKKHRYLAMLDEEQRPRTWEEKLLFYADMRVMHDKIVPLTVRLADGHKRNVHFHGTKAQSRINTAKVDPLIYQLEKEIFEKLDFQPDDVTDEFIDSYSQRTQEKV